MQGEADEMKLESLNEEEVIKWDYLSYRHYFKHIHFFTKQPLLAYRTILGYFRTLALRQKVLRSVELAVNYNCQLNCPKCFASKFYNPKRKYLMPEQIKKIWEQCYKLGAIHINITGGEPLLRPDIVEVIKALKPKGTLISLVTNSLGLTPELAKKLRTAGLNTLQISLDSYKEDVHDEWRGYKGCYKKVMESVDIAKDAGLNVCFTTLLTHQTVKTEELPEMLKIAEKKDVHLLINFAGRSGSWSDRDEVVLTKDDRRIINKYMKNSCARLCEMFNFYRIPGLCLAGKDKLNISAYGDVYPCTHIHLSFGNALEEPIKDIWLRMRSFPYFTRFTTDCLRCDDKEFICKYLDPIAKSERTPVPIEKFQKNNN